MTHRYRLLIGTLTLIGGLLVSGSLQGVVRAEDAPKPAPGAPQPTPEPRRGPTAGDVQRVFNLHYVRTSDMAVLLRAFPAEISYSNPVSRDLKALAVSAKPAVMAVIEETIKRLDVPPPQQADTEILAYVLRGETTPGKPDNLPERLQPVAAQLHALFDYSGYTLQDTLVARASLPGGAKVSSLDPVRASGLPPAMYDFEAQKATVTGSGQNAVLKLEGVRFSTKVTVRQPNSNSFNTMDTGLRADISLHSGQYAVVGKTGTGEDGVVIILVLTARVVE